MNSVCILLFILKHVFSACYFPVEIQGDFATQWLDSVTEVSYTQISISYNSIPGWGECFYRQRELVVLKKGECFKCLRLVQRSKNVNHIYSRDIDECFATGEEALRKCPSEEQKVSEMMLYRRGSVHPVHCPITGRHLIEEGGVVEGCPDESFLHLGEERYQCIGHWEGYGDVKYLSLLDTKLPQLGEKPRPRYRCARYTVDTRNEVTHLSMSNDSTCDSPRSYHQV